MITPSQSSEGIPSVPSPSFLTTPTSELTLNPLETVLSNSGTKSRSGSVSVLKSSRPAPPSPASSRPGSQQFFHSPILTPSSPRDRSGSSSSSRMGSGMQRKVSGASSRQSEWDKDGGKPSRRKSTLGQNFSLPSDDKDDGLPTTSTGNSTSNDTSLSNTPIPEDAIAPSPPASAASPTKQDQPTVVDTREIKIKDYGFPASDERFLGKGQPPPKQKWRMSSFNLGGRRASESASGEGSPRSPESSEDDRKTWGFGLFGWRGFGKRRTMSNESGSAGGVAINDEPEDTDDVVEEEDYFSDEQEQEHEEGGEEPSGTYRVMFPFVSEGANEMGVDEGEILQVTGRGGGIGWVIAEKQGQSGLVPEAYLERIGDRQEDIEEVEEEEVAVAGGEKTTATEAEDQAKGQAKGQATE